MQKMKNTHVVLTRTFALGALLTTSFLSMGHKVEAGFYGGLEMGGLFLSGKQSAAITAFQTPPTPHIVDRTSYGEKTLNKTGFAGTCFLGWRQMFSTWDLGIEPYFQLPTNLTLKRQQTIGGENTALSMRKMNAFGLNVRPSFCVARETGIFLTPVVGAEIGHFRFTWRDDSGQFKQTKSVWAANVGLGVEKRFECFAVGLEVKNTFYGKQEFKVQDQNGQVDATLKANSTSVMARFVVPFQRFS